MKAKLKSMLTCAVLATSAWSACATSYAVDGGGIYEILWDGTSDNVSFTKLINTSGYTVNDIHLYGEHRVELKSFSFADTPSKDKFSSGIVTDPSVIGKWFTLERGKIVGAYWTYNGKTVPPVPEPETMGLAIAGIAVVVALRSRQTNRL